MAENVGLLQTGLNPAGASMHSRVRYGSPVWQCWLDVQLRQVAPQEFALQPKALVASSGEIQAQTLFSAYGYHHLTAENLKTAFLNARQNLQLKQPGTRLPELPNQWFVVYDALLEETLTVAPNLSAEEIQLLLLSLLEERYLFQRQVPSFQWHFIQPGQVTVYALPRPLAETLQTASVAYHNGKQPLQWIPRGWLYNQLASLNQTTIAAAQGLRLYYASPAVTRSLAATESNPLNPSQPQAEWLKHQLSQWLATQPEWPVPMHTFLAPQETIAALFETPLLPADTQQTLAKEAKTSLLSSLHPLPEQPRSPLFARLIQVFPLWVVLLVGTLLWGLVLEARIHALDEWGHHLNPRGIAPVSMQEVTLLQQLASHSNGIQSIQKTHTHWTILFSAPNEAQAQHWVEQTIPAQFSSQLQPALLPQTWQTTVVLETTNP